MHYNLTKDGKTVKAPDGSVATIKDIKNMVNELKNTPEGVLPYNSNEYEAIHVLSCLNLVTYDQNTLKYISTSKDNFKSFLKEL